MCEKTLFWTYFWWVFGGIVGSHHLYLRRDKQAVVFGTCFGFLSLGWITDLFYLEQYVKEANMDSTYIQELKGKVKQHKYPPFSTRRFIGGILIGLYWGSLLYNAVPKDDITGANWTNLYWLAPIGVTVGVWTVGNIGNERGNIWIPLIAAYISYSIFKFTYSGYYLLLLSSTIAQLSFTYMAKEWRLKVPKKQTFSCRVLKLLIVTIIYISLNVCYVYFNMTMTDETGKEIRIYYLVHEWKNYSPEEIFQKLGSKNM